MLTLRDYQSFFRYHILQALRDGANSVLAVLPTGGGKRYSVVDLCLIAMQHSRDVLVVTNRRLLVDQMVKECDKHGVRYGVLMSDYPRGNSYGNIQIASIQSLESWFLKEGLGARRGEGLPPWSLMLIDEAHADIGRYAQLRAIRPEAKTIGFTATPVGAEGKALVTSPYDVMVEGATNSELIAQGHLLPTTVYAPSEPNIEGVKVVNRQEYNQKQLGRRVSECTVFADVYAEWAQHAQDRATVAFVPGIPFGRDLVRQFNFLLGPGSAHLIEAKTKHHEREEIFDLILGGDSRILVSCDVLREGFDLPVLSCGIDLQPNSQLRSYWQKLGRIKRRCEGQENALWLDFAGNYWKFPHPNEDPLWPQGEETTQEAVERSRKAGEARQPIMCPKCSMVRERGPVCPGCGYKAGEAIRRIRMGKGKLREIPAFQKAKREKTEGEKLLSKWQSQLYGALKTGMSYAQAAKVFHVKTGEWPKESWPFVFHKSSVNWTKRPKDELTPSQLYITFKRHR